MEDVLNLAGTSYRSRLIVGDRKVQRFSGDEKSYRSIGRGDRDSSGPPGQHHRSQQRESP